MTREMKRPVKKRRKRVDLKQWTKTHWLPVPVRLLGNKGPLVVGVTDDAKQSVKERWLSDA